MRRVEEKKVLNADGTLITGPEVGIDGGTRA
jgi:hypothetical protein